MYPGGLDNNNSNNNNNKHCIPVAVDYIYGLQTPFRQCLAAAVTGLPRVSSSPVDHRPHRNSYLQVDDNASNRAAAPNS
ncbi:hypothetical protein BG015_009626 [Linnemannia schmuckeri]|uniref:Uncharacterized protein n=1 Tax=Linnemannia schmuckeri TaxID=64567 RepID=A0A9P5RVP4_9FUNG|nr:hypothetical protein BG015_009626 [Linnemannia schmuckeri]